MMKNFSLSQGDTFDRVPFRIIRNGVVVPLTGATLHMEVAAMDGTLIQTLAQGAGLAILDEEWGEISQQNPSWPVGKYTYFLRVTFASSWRKTYLRGVIQIKAAHLE